MGNRLSFGAEGTHEAEILQPPRTKDKAKAAGGYTTLSYTRNFVTPSISPDSQNSHAKFQRFNAKETFLNLRLNRGGVEKNVHFFNR